MILFIDNYDSFTYNLVQYIGELEKDVLVYRNDKISLKEIEKLSPKGIVISPGPGTPINAGISVSVIKSFYKDVPILGVCLGHQAIGYAFGASIVGAKDIVHGKTSLINHDGSSLFKDIESPFSATRYHSLIVERASLPSCFDISCSLSDGTIMGIRHKEHIQLQGVQFHPESILTACGKVLIRNFVDQLALKC